MVRFALAALLLTSRLAAAQLPDLTTEIGEVFFDPATTADPADVAEGCAATTSGRDLLRFDVFTRNIGQGDLVIGDPLCPDCVTNPGAVCGNPDYHCSPGSGHHHPHFTDYARYDLLQGPTVVATSGKFGFCLEDSFCPKGTKPFFTCENQGLTAGCADLYNTSVGCQYIDVTGLPDGPYTLRTTADPLDKIAESDEGNNIATRDVTLARHPQPDELVTGRAAVASLGGVRFVGVFPTGTLPSVPPTTAGVRLTITDSGPLGRRIGALLPASRWQGIGTPPGASGWRYRGATSDPCRSALITARAVKASCHRIQFVAPVSGDLRFVLTIGSGPKRYCASFGGTTVRNDEHRFRAKNAPSAPCASPSGAFLGDGPQP